MNGRRLAIFILLLERIVGTAVASAGSPQNAASCDPAKQPVLLIPGGEATATLAEDVDGLAQLYPWLQADGYVLGCNLFWANTVSAFKTRQENRQALQALLRAAYDEVLVRDPAWQGHFHIIGHSFGGLIGRFYLESSYYTNDRAYGPTGIHVDNLITLGTPHGGTILPQEAYPGAMIIAGERLFAPGDLVEFLAVAQLHSDLMQAYNAAHRQPPDVRYHLIAGDFLLQEDVPPLVRALYAPYAEHPGDIGVSLRSATALGRNPYLQPLYPRVCVVITDDMHGYTQDFGLGDLRSYGRPSRTYEQAIRPILGKQGGDCSAGVRVYTPLLLTAVRY